MRNQLISASNECSSKNLSAEENRSRRLFEMYRRFKSLQAQRFHLRNQLAAVDKYLDSLDNQIKSYESYDQINFSK